MNTHRKHECIVLGLIVNYIIQKEDKIRFKTNNVMFKCHLKIISL